MTRQHQFSDLLAQLSRGDLSRRHFMQASAALGVSTATASLLAGSVSAQDATPSASPAATPAAVTLAPAVGTEGQERGAGGELRIIQSQAPTVLAAHSSTGSKDTYAGSLVLEPLLAYLQDGSLAPVLAAAVALG